MSTLILSHVTIGAVDVEAAMRFYLDLLGPDHVELLPSPNLGGPTVKVIWLRLGPVQLHIGQRPQNQRDEKDHFGIGVSSSDLFHQIFRKARDGGFLQPRPFGHYIYELPGGDVQLYVKDPAGNTLEIDYPYARDLDRTLITDLRLLSEKWPQDERALQSSLFESPLGSTVRAE